VTFGKGADYFEIADNNTRAYAACNGYRYINTMRIPELRALAEPKGKPIANAAPNSPRALLTFKLTSVRWVLERQPCRCVLWHDADSLFFNFSKRIEEIIDDRYDVILTTSPPFSGHWAQVVNSGHFLVRNTPFGRRFVADAEAAKNQSSCKLTVKDPAPPPLNGWLNVCDERGTWWLEDQGILQHLLVNTPRDYSCHIKQVNYREFNSQHPWYGPGDLVVHFLGMRPKKKHMQIFMKLVNFRDGTFRLPDDPSLRPRKNPDHVSNASAYDSVNHPCTGL